MKSVYVVGKSLVVAGDAIIIDGKKHILSDNSENIVVTNDCIEIGNTVAIFNEWEYK